MVSSDAPNELVQLRAELVIAREQAEHARDKALLAEAEVAKVWAINADLLACNARLELMNEQMRRDRYGARSERSRRLLDQLELTWSDQEPARFMPYGIGCTKNPGEPKSAETSLPIDTHLPIFPGRG